MRDNYNRPQMRGYWDAPKSKDDSRYEILFIISPCSFVRSSFGSFVLSFVRLLACWFLRWFVRSFVRSLACSLVPVYHMHFQV